MSCAEHGHCDQSHVVERVHIERNVERVTRACCECGRPRTETVRLTPADSAYVHGPHLPKRLEIA
jgi:hypothetical protein